MTTDTPSTDACPHCGSTTMHGRNLCGTENGNRTTECYLWEKTLKSEAEVAFWKSKAHEAEDREGKLESEVERLKIRLEKAVEIAEDLKKGGEMALQVIRESGRWAFEPHDDPRAEIKWGVEKLAALKGEIK